MRKEASPIRGHIVNFVDAQHGEVGGHLVDRAVIVRLRPSRQAGPEGQKQASFQCSAARESPWLITAVKGEMGPGGPLHSTGAMPVRSLVFGAKVSSICGSSGQYSGHVAFRRLCSRVMVHEVELAFKAALLFTLGVLPEELTRPVQAHHAA